MKSIWQMDNLKAMILLFQIGYRNGKKYGDRMTDKEYQEVYERHTDWLTKLGHTELSIAEYVQELASHGKQIIYIPNTLLPDNEKEK